MISIDSILRTCIVGSAIAISATAHSQTTDTSFIANGTGGAGYFEAANQSAAPSTPTLAGRIYFDSMNRLSWIGTSGQAINLDTSQPGLLHYDGSGLISGDRVAAGVIQRVIKSDRTWFVSNEDAVQTCPVIGMTTNSQCLQEAINEAFTNQYELHVHGGGSGRITDPFPTDLTQHTFSTTGITVPVTTAHYASISGLSLFFCGDAPLCSSEYAQIPTNGLVFDSADMLTFQFTGQIGYHGSGSVFQFAPINGNQEGPPPGLKEVFAGRFDLPSLIPAFTNSSGNTGTGLQLTPGPNDIGGSYWTIREINTGLVGIQVDNPTDDSQGTFSNNRIEAQSIHEMNGTGAKIGSSTTDKIFGNYWFLPFQGIGTGIDTWEVGGTYITNIFGATTGIKMESGSAGNIAIVSYNAASTPILDAGMDNTFLMPRYIGTGSGGMHLASGATLNGNTWTAQNNNGAAIVEADDASRRISFYADTGTTAGSTFTPTEIGHIDASGLTVAALTMAGVNQATAWTDTTPSPACNGGSGASLQAVVSQKLFGKTTFLQLSLDILTFGTCSGGITVQLQHKALVDAAFAARIEQTGEALSAQVLSGSDQLVVQNTSGNSPGTSANRVIVGGVYETQ